jgi:exodeoxyribonuclease VII large subunit
VRGCELVAALGERAKRAETVGRLRRRERLTATTARLAAGLRANADAHRSRIGRQCERVAMLCERARRAVDASLRQRVGAVERCGQLLNALSHRGVLARGFALVRDDAGRPLRKAAVVSSGMRLDIEFSDGHVPAVAEGSPAAATERPTPAPKPRGRRGNGNSSQGNLFGA